MPLNTEILRKGKRVKNFTWNEHMLNIFLSVGLSEGDPKLWKSCLGDISADELTFIHDGVAYERPMSFMMVPIYYLKTKAPLWKVGKHTVKSDHKFIGEDYQPIEIKAGDVLQMWRS